MYVCIYNYFPEPRVWICLKMSAPQEVVLLGSGAKIALIRRYYPTRDLSHRLINPLLT